jgi:PEGA domain
MYGAYAAAILLGFLGMGMGAQAQDIAETASATSSSAINVHTVQAMKAPPVTLAVPASQSSSPYLPARTGPPPDEVNRKDFEDNAGEKAGKLFFRSVPSGAEIFLNDLLVGRTPLLMVVAPGKYKIDMRGSREESGHSTVGVMPKETQTVVINLNQKYPANVTMR